MYGFPMYGFLMYGGTLCVVDPLLQIVPLSADVPVKRALHPKAFTAKGAIALALNPFPPRHRSLPCSYRERSSTD